MLQFDAHFWGIKIQKYLNLSYHCHKRTKLLFSNIFDGNWLMRWVEWETAAISREDKSMPLLLKDILNVVLHDSCIFRYAPYKIAYEREEEKIVVEGERPQLEWIAL